MNFDPPQELVPSVLVLDDDAHFRVLLSSLIKTTGVNVYEARNARDADQILFEQRPSLAIVDYRLPGMDGMEWITKIRGEGNNIPLVFLTGTWCDAKTFNRLRSLLRVSLILQKPIVPDLFLEQVEFLLPQMQVQAPPSVSAPSIEAYQNEAQSEEETAEVVSDDAYVEGPQFNEFGEQEPYVEPIEPADANQNSEEDSYEALKASRERHVLIDEAHRRQEEALAQSEKIIRGPNVSGTRMPAMRPCDAPYGKDAMRMSNSSMPAFDVTAAADNQTSSETAARV